MVELSAISAALGYAGILVGAAGADDCDDRNRHRFQCLLFVSAVLMLFGLGHLVAGVMDSPQ